MTGAEAISAERRRQIEAEGWTPQHDDEHTDGALALAAVSYATPVRLYREFRHADVVIFRDPWPWGEDWDKRPRFGNVVMEAKDVTISARRLALVKAGALIAAEIDRLDRLENTHSKEQP